MLLILTEPNDSHADYVAAKLRDRGAAFLRFDPARFPREAEISLACSAAGAPRQILRLDDEVVDLASVTAVWYRRPETPVAHESLAGRAREFVELESTLVVKDLLSSLDCPWLPAPPLVVRNAEQRFLQLKIAGELGFELPQTLTTNSPAELLDFYRRHDGRIVSKQAGTAFSATIGFDVVRFTELVTTRDIAHAHAIRLCPMTFQEYVPKRFELRITVVGGQVFAAEIHSQATNHTRFDWRRYDHGRTPHVPHVLPPVISARCVALVQRLGLRYGAIDMVVTPDDRYVFLEINPNGQYLFIELKTHQPISDAICDLLMAGETQASREACCE